MFTGLAAAANRLVMPVNQRTLILPGKIIFKKRPNIEYIYPVCLSVL